MLLRIKSESICKVFSTVPDTQKIFNVSHYYCYFKNHFLHTGDSSVYKPKTALIEFTTGNWGSDAEIKSVNSEVIFKRIGV